MRCSAGLVVVLGVGILAAASVPGSLASSEAAVSEEASFTVHHLGEPQTVRGTLVRPASAPACASSVVVLLHGLSYARWGFDFPLRPAQYSVARALAERGYASLALDELGYGASDQPDGRTVTSPGLSLALHEIVQALRSGAYAGAAPVAFGHVATLGHSAGSDQAQLEAGLFQDVDAVISTAFHHDPHPDLAPDAFAGILADAATKPYISFDASTRTHLFYNLSLAETDVVALDNALAVPTPSAQFLTGALVPPSRAAMPLLTMPLLFVAAGGDRIFAVQTYYDELPLYTLAADKTVAIVPSAGHSFMLHTNAALAHDLVADWLDARQGAMPRC